MMRAILFGLLIVATPLTANAAVTPSAPLVQSPSSLQPVAHW